MERQFNTIMEPFRIKSVEPLHFTSEEQRRVCLEKAGYNVFGLRADDVLIDLLTDSGTAAMSANQWAGIISGDESYAGSRSFYRFEEVVKNITGYKHVIPTHQGRASERILFSIVGGKDKVFPSNSHFDTTRANIEFTEAKAVDLLTDIGKNPEVYAPFKGDIDLVALEAMLIEYGPARIPFCMITVTNNSGGGQPVSMANVKAASALCRKYGVPLLLDACRFAENCYFIKAREQGFADTSILDIAKELFSYADGCTMSAKKDGMANIGGFLALNHDEIAQKARNLLIITEGFPTYGGMAGRDLEAIAIGLMEAMDEDYLRYRIRCAQYLGEILMEAGVPIVNPPGGHAVYLDAKRFYPHIKPSEFPGQTLACELYLVGGIRGVEIGSVMFGRQDEQGNHVAPPMELVRLALPRRVYTQSHTDYVAEAIIMTHKEREGKRGYRLVYAPQFLRHFTATFAPL